MAALFIDPRKSTLATIQDYRLSGVIIYVTVYSSF